MKYSRKGIKRKSLLKIFREAFLFSVIATLSPGECDIV